MIKYETPFWRAWKNKFQYVQKCGEARFLTCFLGEIKPTNDGRFHATVKQLQNNVFCRKSDIKNIQKTFTKLDEAKEFVEQNTKER